MELLAHMLILCLTFCRTTKLFHGAVPFHILTSNAREFQLLHICANTCSFLSLSLCVCVCDNNHHDACEVVSHSGLFIGLFLLGYS